MLIPQLAGWIDAEGCIRVEKTGTPRLGFGQTRSEALLKIYDAWPGGLMYLYKSEDPNDLRCLTLIYVAQDRVKAILEATLPYLRIKREEAECLLAFLARPLSQKSPTIIQKTSARLSVLKKRPLTTSMLATAAAKPKVCLIEACLAPPRARGYCNKHYLAHRNHALREGTWQAQPDFHPFSYARQPAPDELLYIAGLFDGDGNVWFDTHGPRITFGQTSGAAIALVAAIYGGTIRTKAARGKRRAQGWHTIQNRAGGLRFLRDVHPYLAEKRLEVDLVLALFSGGDTAPIDRTLYESTLERITTLRETELPPDFLHQLGYIPPQQAKAELPPILCRLCGQPRVWQDLCAKHRRRMKLYGDPTLKKVPRGRGRPFVLVHENEKR